MLFQVTRPLNLYRKRPTWKILTSIHKHSGIHQIAEIDTINQRQYIGFIMSSLFKIVMNTVHGGQTLQLIKSHIDILPR